MTTAKHLIARSVSHDEIVHADWTAELASDLSSQCDDSVNASDSVVEYWGTDDDGDDWRVHLAGERKPINSLKSIRVESSSDAGCDWTDAEQGDFCAAVVESLSQTFPGVEVECEVVDRADTRVFVYGRERPAGLVTHPDQESDLIEAIKAAVQDVWDGGGFWAPVDVHAEDESNESARVRSL